MSVLKSLIMMSLALALPAMAAEKALDAVNIKSGIASFQTFSGTLDGSSPIYDRIHGTAVDANCGAPMFDSVNDGMAFDIQCVEVIDTNPIEIILDPRLTNISDTVLTLYCDPFDPLAPSLNVVAFDDDDGMATLSALAVPDNIRLVPGLKYWVVVSTYGAGMHGSYTVQLSDNVFPCGGVASEGTTWGGIKGLFR
jgi:hypothetical protein